MIRYKDVKEKMSVRGIDFTPTQYSFALMVAIGINKYEAYKIVIIADKLIKIEPEKLPVLEEKWFKECDIYVQQQSTKALIQCLTESYKAQISEDALKLEDVNITPKQLKNILGKVIMDSQKTNGDSEVDTEDLIKLINQYMKNFAPSDNNDDFEHHFVQIFPPFNFICRECNKEGDAPMGLDFHCPHCGKLYKWSEEEKRYF